MDALTKLSFGYHESRVLARIISKWDSFSTTAYYTPMINFILVDAEHEQYWVVAPISERDRLMPVVFPGMLYHITNFKIVAAHGTLKPLQTDKMLVFGGDTQWHDYLFRSSIPHSIFTTCSWPILVTRTNNDSLLSAVTGVIIHVSNLEYKLNDVQRIDITLIDKSLVQIHVSLWDVKARAFKRDFKDHRKKNVVVMITGLLVKIRKGKIYLSSTPATNMFFNSKCAAVRNLAENISAAYGDFICCQPQEIEHRYQILPQDNIITPSLTLEQLLGIWLWFYQKYHCSVTIIGILLRGCRHDGSCLACKGCVTATENRYYCASCGRNFVTPTTRPSIVLHVSDHTGQTKFNIHPPELRRLTGYSRKEILKDHKLVNGTWTFPTALDVIKGAKCTFEIMLAPSSYSNTTGKFIIDGIIQYRKFRTTAPA